MTATVTRVDAIRRIRRGDEADRLAQAAYDDLLVLLRDLGPRDWDRATPCPGWTVRDMVAHMVGAAEGHAAPAEMIRQALAGRRDRAAFDGNDLDAMNAHQIAQHRHESPAELVAHLKTVAPRAVRGRRKVPALLRRLSLPISDAGSIAAGTPRSVRVGELLDVVLTRDVWMHRLDIARATDRDVPLGPTDRRIVEDLVAAWARRHGRPVDLVLTGPAGGRYVQGRDGVRIERDALEFALALSGRADSDGLLGTRLLF